MYRSRPRRTALLLLALLVLALPAAAQPSQSLPSSPLGRLLATVWSQLSSPLTSLWAEGRAHIDPNGSTNPPASEAPPTGTNSDGRADIDPNG